MCINDYGLGSRYVRWRWQKGKRELQAVIPWSNLSAQVQTQLDSKQKERLQSPMRRTVTLPTCTKAAKDLSPTMEGRAGASCRLSTANRLYINDNPQSVEHSDLVVGLE